MRRMVCPFVYSLYRKVEARFAAQSPGRARLHCTKVISSTTESRFLSDQAYILSMPKMAAAIRSVEESPRPPPQVVGILSIFLFRKDNSVPALGG